MTHFVEAWADFDGDGHLDVAHGGGYPTLPDGLEVCFGEQGGLLPLCEVLATEEVDTPTYTSDVAAADLDGDGVLDLVIGHNGTTDGPGGPVTIAGGQGAWCWGEVSGNFECEEHPFSPVAQEVAVCVADFDGEPGREVFYGLAPAMDCDGWCTVGPSYDPLLCDPLGGCPSPIESVASTDYFNNFAVGDFDGDGDLDAAVAVHRMPWPTPAPDLLYVNNGTGGFDVSSAAFGLSNEVSLDFYPVDVDKDADLDLFRLRLNPVGPAVVLELCLNDGSGVFSCSDLKEPGPFALASPPTFTWGYLVGDVDEDGDQDVLMQDSYTNDPWFLLNDGAGSYTEIDADPLTETKNFAPGWHDGYTVDLLASDLLDTASQPITRVLLHPNRATDNQPGGTEARLWVRPDPERAPILVTDDTIIALPTTDSLTLHVEMFTDNVETTPWIEQLDIYTCMAPQDADGDGCDDGVDPDPAVPDVADSDSDGLPDVCDTCPDVDGDGVPSATLTGDATGCLSPAGLVDIDDDDRFACIPGIGGCDQCGVGWYHPRLSGDLDGDGECDDVDLDDDGDGCDDTEDEWPEVVSGDGDADGVPDDCDPQPDNECEPVPIHADCIHSTPSIPQLWSPFGEVYELDDPVTLFLRNSWDDYPPVTYEFVVAADPELTEFVVGEAGVIEQYIENGDELGTTWQVPAPLEPGPYWWSARAIDRYGLMSNWYGPHSTLEEPGSFRVLPGDDDDSGDDDDHSDDDVTPIDDDDSGYVSPPGCDGCSVTPGPTPAALLSLGWLGLAIVGRKRCRAGS